MYRAKLRVWDEELKNMVYDFNEPFDDEGSLQYLITQFEDSSIGVIAEGENRKLVEMWSTGLKDKNGLTDIFEGDVWERSGFMGEVVWEFSGWAIKTLPTSNSYQYPSFHSNAVTGKIIGNRFENPELLDKP